MELTKISQLKSKFHDSGIFEVQHNLVNRTLSIMIETSEDDGFAPNTNAKMVFHEVENLQSTQALDILNEWDTLGDVSSIEAQSSSREETVKIYITIHNNSQEHKSMMISFSTIGFEWIPE